MFSKPVLQPYLSKTYIFSCLRDIQSVFSQSHLAERVSVLGFVWECFQNQRVFFYFKTGHQKWPNLFKVAPNQDHVQPSLCLSLPPNSRVDVAVCLCGRDGNRKALAVIQA